MEHPTIQVNATGEKVQINGEILKIEDHTKATFQTNAIMAFLPFVKAKAPLSDVFITNTGAVAYLNGDEDFYTEPIAVLECRIHPIVQTLRGQNDRKMSPPEFEKFIRIMRQYMTGEGAIQLRDFSTNMNIQKVKTITRQKDHSGNYSYAVASEAGKNDFEAPKSVVFKIPLVADIPESFEFEMDFFLSITENENGPKVEFEFNRPMLGYDIDQAIIASIQKAVDAAGFTSYLGFKKIKQQTNKGLMLENPVIIKN